ncbi:hypothetical protein [Rhizobium leguminosarum]|uniref:hypothetical protein n=1 Tax=Rhizobium leguminosarum TaxID=384 RepID=UPI0015B8EDEC|nr:hypothetical protein [Rhizobium leguminosarum]
MNDASFPWPKKLRRRSKSMNKKVRPAKTVHAGPLSFCMYCGDEKSQLSDEHIVPYWMAGGWILKKSSCERRAKVTRGFEENLAYTAFSGLRHRLRLQSRSKSEPPKFKVLLNESGNKVERTLSADELPALFFTWAFKPPGLLEGRPFTEGIREVSFRFTNLSGLVAEEKPFSGTVEVASDPFNHMRLAAKIAHGFLHFHEDGHREYIPLLSDVILTGNFAPYFVGGVLENDEFKPPQEHGVKPMHFLGFTETKLPGDNVHTYLVARVHLFEPYGGPVFQVVTARKRNAVANLLAYPYAHPIPTSDGTEIERFPAKLVVSLRSGPPVAG